MIDILTNDNRKILMLTYPKGASTSLRTILLPSTGHNTDVNQFGERWILEEGLRHTEVFDALKKYSDYTMYAFCREPVDRWSSTLLFLMQTKWDLFYSEISDTGQQIADNINANYLITLVSNMVAINNNSGHFGNVHMWRPLFTLLQIKILYGDNMHLMQLDQMENIICDIHDVERQPFKRSNEAMAGYNDGHGYTSNQTHIPTLSTKWQSIVPYAIRNEESLEPVRNYLAVDNEIYRRVVLGGEDATDVLISILTKVKSESSFLEPIIFDDADNHTNLGINDFQSPLKAFLELIPQFSDLYNIVVTSVGRFDR